MFLSPDELVELTGRTRKSMQIVALRSMGIPFLVNAIGKPVVTVAAVEGRSAAAEKQKHQRWQSNAVRQSA